MLKIDATLALRVLLANGSSVDDVIVLGATINVNLALWVNGTVVYERLSKCARSTLRWGPFFFLLLL